MALPSTNDIANYQFSWLGQPFVRLPAKSSISTLNYDYAWLGQPFVTPDTGAATTDTEFATTLTATSAFVGETVTVVSADATVTLALSPSFDSQTVTVVESDLSAGAALSSSFDSETLTIVESDLSASAALTSSWELIAQQISSADMSTTLALSTSWDSAFSTVAGSTWSVSIDDPSGPMRTVSRVASGTGYSFDQILRIDGGNNDGQVQVKGIFGTSVNFVQIYQAGTGYTAGVTYPTTRLTGSTGTGCTVRVDTIVDIYHQFVSGATKGSALSSPQTLTPTFRALTFAGVDMTSTLALTCDGVSGATAGSAMSTSDAATVDWQGLGIGPVPVDWTTVLTCVAAWGGQQIRVLARLEGSTGPFDLLGRHDNIELRGE
jgi:hypothetical protein